MVKEKRKLMLSGLLSSVVILSGCSAMSTGEQDTSVQETDLPGNELNKEEQSKESLQDSKEYLEEAYNVEFDGVLAKNEIDSSINKIFGADTYSVEGENGLDFIKVINQVSGLEELAFTYSDEKTDESLEKLDIDSDIDDDLEKYVASSLDSHLLSIENIENLVSADDITADMGTKVFMEAVNFNGVGRNYLGYSNDKDIYEKLHNSRDSFMLFNNEDIAEVGAELIKEEVITGYNMKSEAYNSNFLPDKSLNYGHSDLGHVIQLIGLLNSEDLVAKVQLEPKISAFEYLDEWGDINELSSSEDITIEEYDDINIQNGIEFDLALEFESIEDMSTFSQIIDDYAKRNEENNGEDLIINSWWQPMILTSNSEKTEEDFYEVSKVEAKNEEGISMVSVTLKEDNEEVAKEIKKRLKDYEINKGDDYYTNLAFYDYLRGEDYQ